MDELEEKGWEEALEEIKEEDSVFFKDACDEIGGEYENHYEGNTEVCKVDGERLVLRNEDDVGTLETDNSEAVIGDVEYIYTGERGQFGDIKTMTLDGDGGTLTLKNKHA